MATHPYLPSGHPLSHFYRAGAAVLGLGLIAFGVTGLLHGVAFLSTDGASMVGMGMNGLLAIISIVVGAILIAAALRGGVVASSTMAVTGGLFVISGLVNLAVLDTALNLLAFRFPNVVFSLVVGVVLLTAGLHGRVSGGLPDDNPFVQARGKRPVEDPTRVRARLAELDEMATAEYAAANGRATPAQAALVSLDRSRRARAHREQHQQLLP